MKQGELLCNGQTLISCLFVAEGPLERMKGLLGRKYLPAGQGMHLDPASVIHTFFMRFPIDLIFLDTEMRVTRSFRNIRPFKLVYGGEGACSVVEVESGWLPDGAAIPGDKLNLS